MFLFLLCSIFSSFAAKNRTSSPSSTSLHHPTNIGSKISVSSNNLKRETSPTVCCYNINSRSQSVRKSEGSFDTFANVQRAEKKLIGDSNLTDIHKNRSQNQKSFTSKLPSDVLIQNREKITERSFSYLKDKIRKFENPPNNIHENIINRSTTTIRAEEATVDPVKCVSEDDQRKYDDKNSRFRRTFLINRDESQSKGISGERCNSKFVNDGNNNQVKELRFQPESDTENSSLTTARQLRDSKDINIHCRDDIKLTKVIVKHLAPIDVNKKSQVEAADSNIRRPSYIVPKQSSLNDNDFTFIDSSSRSVSRSSSTSFVSDDLCDEKVNQRKLRIPKITRINNNNCNLSQEFSVKTCANQNIYSRDQSENYFTRNGCDATGIHKKSYLNNYPGNDHQLTSPINTVSPTIINQSAAPEKSVSFHGEKNLSRDLFSRKIIALVSKSNKPTRSFPYIYRKISEKDFHDRQFIFPFSSNFPFLWLESGREKRKSYLAHEKRNKKIFSKL